MQLLVQDDLVFLDLEVQEDGALTMPGGLVDTVEQCEPDGSALKVVVNIDHPLYAFPKKMLPCFLRYAAKNPIEQKLQSEIAKLLKDIVNQGQN